MRSAENSLPSKVWTEAARARNSRNWRVLRTTAFRSWLHASPAALPWARRFATFCCTPPPRDCLLSPNWRSCSLRGHSIFRKSFSRHSRRVALCSAIASPIRRKPTRGQAESWARAGAALHGILCGDLQPDLTILMDSDVAASVDRARRRNLKQKFRGQRKAHGDENRFEQENRAFFGRVRSYLAIADREPQRVLLSTQEASARNARGDYGGGTAQAEVLRNW